MIDLGQMDRTCQLVNNVSSAGVGAAPTYTRSVLFTFYATLVRPSLLNQIKSSRDTINADAIFLTRWCDLSAFIVDGLYITCEGHNYRVVQTQELGRREGLSFAANTQE